MRQYRGKRIDNGLWIEGCLFKYKFSDKVYIVSNSYSAEELRYDKRLFNMGFAWNEVLPESVGQSTGLKDCKGVEIFGSIEINGNLSKGGDILSYKEFTVPEHKGAWSVNWNAYFWDVIRHFAALYDGDKDFGWFEGKDFFWENHARMEKIGNVTDNPEFLKMEGDSEES